MYIKKIILKNWEIAKYKRGKCISKDCTNDIPKNQKIRHCPKCRKRKFAKKYPLKDKFYNLRSHAGRKNIKFKLTYAQFERFLKKHRKHFYGFKNRAISKNEFNICID